MTAKEGLACGQILVLRIVREKMQSFMFPYVFGLTNKNKKKVNVSNYTINLGFRVQTPYYYDHLIIILNLFLDFKANRKVVFLAR